LVGLLLGLLAVALPPVASGQDGRPSPENYKDELPWDFKPYQVLIWVAGVDGPQLDAVIREPLIAYLDRDFAALWRTDVRVAPADLSVLAERDFSRINYATLTATDPVVCIKRNHPEAARIRFQNDVAKHVKEILVAPAHAEAIARRGAAVDNGDLHGMVPNFVEGAGDLLSLRERWAEESTEAVLLPRGMMLELDPEPKVIEIDVADRMGDTFGRYDKIFLVQVDGTVNDAVVSAREVDCLMRHPGPIIRRASSSVQMLPATIGSCVRHAFAPVVRIEDVGTKSITGTIRGGGLILNEDSPANVGEGDYLQPLMRKDDRTGEPSLLGVVDWTYLKVEDKSKSEVTLKMHSGRAGALAGRRNNRTHRMALKTRPVFPHTTLRLHAKGDPTQPLAGYDIYEKDPETGDWTEVGQTDWDGRLKIEKTDDPMRLLYVKNGLQVLARLPMVPGQTPLEAADLIGDDIRLEAESYIRGVQNAIIDLVGIRKLLADQIRRHIANEEFDRAQEVLDQLRQQPSYDLLADDMAIKQTQIVSPNRNEQAKIEQLFGQTRTLLVEHINQSLVNRLDQELIAARRGQPLEPPADEASE
jgi:hypothetical protein